MPPHIKFVYPLGIKISNYNLIKNLKNIQVKYRYFRVKD